MLLSDILKNVEVLNPNDVFNMEIDGIEIDSKMVKANYLFVCLKGTKVDGHKFKEQAKQNGAVAFLVEKFDYSFEGMQILVSDSRRALSFIAKNFYIKGDMPKMIGITGTNGKTTTSYMVESILKSAGKKVGVIGTQGARYFDEKLPLNMTTPDPLELFKLIAWFNEKGVEFVVMEVSAHAIALKKVDAINFSVKALTNITEDHLDFFKSVRNYKNTKLEFMKYGKGKCVLNLDDHYGLKLYQQGGGFYGYSKNLICDTYSFHASEDCSCYSVNTFGDIFDVKTSIMGDYNLSNSLCAVSICKLLEIENEYIASGLKDFKAVEGRFNVFKAGNKKIIVDFAHTPDAFLNVMNTARCITNGNMFVVFGCGGDREKEKRKKMGVVASKLCDFVFVTVDNPRSEKPLDICSEIAKGIKNKKYEIIIERKDAIFKAFKSMKDNDTLLILGKGAENYIEIKGEKLPYCDLDVVKEILSGEDKIDT